MSSFFSPLPLWQNKGVALVRFVMGASLIYHGCEIFDTPAMNEYLKWDMFKNISFGRLFVYGGKVLEFIAGILLFAGFLTRVACLIVIGTLSYIAFFVGHGKIWYEDQYPFLFVILGFMFIFTGPGAYSLDNVIFNRKK